MASISSGPETSSHFTSLLPDHRCISQDEESMSSYLIKYDDDNVFLPLPAVNNDDNDDDYQTSNSSTGSGEDEDDFSSSMRKMMMRSATICSGGGGDGVPNNKRWVNSQSLRRCKSAGNGGDRDRDMTSRMMMDNCRILIRPRGSGGGQIMCMDMDELKGCTDLDLDLSMEDCTVHVFAPFSSCNSGSSPTTADWCTSSNHGGRGGGGGGASETDPMETMARLKVWAHAVAHIASASAALPN